METPSPGRYERKESGEAIEISIANVMASNGER